MKKTNAYLWVAMLCALPLLCGGCFGTSSEFKAVKNDVVESMSTSVEEGHSFGLGRISLGLARTVLSFVPGEDDEELQMAKDLIRVVRKIEVGYYQLDDVDDANRRDILSEIDPTMMDAGLEPVIRHVESGELVTIYIEIDDDKVKQFFVVVLDGSELIMVRVHGQLEKAVLIALEETDMDFLEL